MADLKQAINKVLEHEGGYVNDPNDPGGETNFGISKRAYPSLDIKNLTRDEAAAIYEEDYVGSGYAQLASQYLANILIDFGVNAGVSRALKTFVAALRATVVGPVAWTGALDDSAVRLANGAPEVPLCLAYTRERVRYYISLNKPQYLAGWIERALDW